MPPRPSARIFTGYALDPVDNLITEFLPDVASRVHIRIIFVQRILNNIASTPAGMPSPSTTGFVENTVPSTPYSPFNAKSRRSATAMLRYGRSCAYS